MGFGHDLHQIEVSRVVFCQQDQVVISLFLDPVVSLGHVDFAADDGLHRRVLLGKFEELFHAEHIAVIRDGQGRHPQLFGPVKEVLDGRLTVQDGVLCMNVKVYECHGTKITKSRGP